MNAWWIRCAGLALAALLLPSAEAGARPPQALESQPQAQAFIEGRSAEFSIRFDAPVDHRQSQLQVLRDGRVVQTLQPRLEAAPNVLFAMAPALPAGEYQLRWVVRAPNDAEVAEGSLRFTVRAPGTAPGR